MTKSWIKRGLIASGATRLAGELRSSAAVILMYHSVLDYPEVEYLTLGRIMHDANVFRGHMEELARHYHPVTMDAVMEHIRGERELPRRAVAVTFDDGYRDNYEIAAPILEKAGIPATFYITVDCVEKARLPWVSRLRYAFFTTRLKQWRSEREAVLPLTGRRREATFLLACDYCATLSGEDQDRFVASLEAGLEISPPERHQSLMMTWDQVRALADRGHTIGSHTMTHPNVAFISDDQARIELGESKRRLESILGSPVVHFSYPCPALVPHWNDSTTQICRELGYRTAVTTNSGSVHRDDDPLLLRRAGPTKRLEGLRWSVDCSFMDRAWEGAAVPRWVNAAARHAAGATAIF